MAAPKAFRRRAALVAIVLVAAACGDDDDTGALSTDDETTSSISAPSTAPPDDPGSDPESTEPAELEFRPVLQLLPPGDLPAAEGDADSGCVTPDADWSADGSVFAPQLSDGEEVGCYELGPVGVDGSIVESATAADGGIGWNLALVLTEDGIVAFNETTRACFDAAPGCPTRQLAIVIDRNVLSAPSINAPEFERDQISISGDFTRDEAEALAGRIG